MKILSSLYKILPVVLFFFISTLPVQALSFPSTQPTGEISGGKFNQILTNIFFDCGAGKYIQGFTSTGVADCKSVANFNTLTLAAGQSNATSGSGLFQKYFTKILNDCGTGRYVRGFDASKNLICEDKTQAVTLMGESVSLVSPVVTVPFPPTPAGQSPGGTFTDSFNTLFSADCGVGKYLQGFDASKNKICGSIVTTIAISDCTQLQNIGTNATTLSGSYHLTGDIDCSATNTWNGGLGFKPIGNSTTPFKGTLDGAGYKIMGLSIHRPTENNVGLFGLANDATIKNIGIDGADMIGNYNVGGLAGTIYSSFNIGSSNNRSSISNSYSTGSTFSGSVVGGLIGFTSSSSISNSYSTNYIISGKSGVGGLIGYANNSSISNSYATNNKMNGTNTIGGLVGNNNVSSIANSYATNNKMNGTDTVGYIGGFVGFNNSSSVTGSYTTSNAINGNGFLGGFVGGNNNSPISNSYATNTIISGTIRIGGFIGYMNGTSESISNSYTTNNTIGGTSLVGGFVGSSAYASNPITSSYYNKDTFTGATSYGSGKTTFEMITQGVYTDWDFSSATNKWKPMSALVGYYPCLAWQNASTCVKAPGTITNCTELQNIGTNTGTLAGSYRLASDIDCSATTTWNGGLGFKPIGNSTTPFKGTFDGAGYKILGLHINRPSENYVGLFGGANGAIIKNIGVDGASIQGTSFIGGLIGVDWDCSVSNSYATNNVLTGSVYVGGFIGSAYSVSISNSYATGNIISGGNAGGLVGSTFFSSSIVDSYVASSIIHGDGNLGGLVGYNFAAISNSHANNNTINGSSGVGGLVGQNQSSSPMTNSYATNNTISGTSELGGLVGYNPNTPISNSYATDNTISGTFGELGGLVGMTAAPISNSYAINNTINGLSSSLGGLVGNNNASVSNSYATNNVINGSINVGGLVGANGTNSITSSYYNKDTFTGATSFGTPKTTAEMITQGTYTGWDFNADWKPMSGALTGYYPCLAWQSAGSCVKPIVTYTAGCDTPDIIVGSYTMAACNVGTTISGLTSASYGNYYQWGRNDNGFTSAINSSGDWTSPQNDNLWGDTTNTSIARQGPCANGYHVPSQPEWQGILTAGGWGSNCQAMSIALKLPFAGLHYMGGGGNSGQSTDGYYWSSSPYSFYSSMLLFNSANTVVTYYQRANGFPVRCIKN